jgi:hypothetical protein
VSPILGLTRVTMDGAVFIFTIHRYVIQLSHCDDSELTLFRL